MPIPQEKIQALVEKSQRKTLELISDDVSFPELTSGLSDKEILQAASKTDYGKLITEVVLNAVRLGLELGREAVDGNCTEKCFLCIEGEPPNDAHLGYSQCRATALAAITDLMKSLE